MEDKDVDSSKKNRLVTTQTDMMPEYLADIEKLRAQEERWYYTKNEHDNSRDDEQLDEEFKSYYKSKGNENEDSPAKKNYSDREDKEDKEDKLYRKEDIYKTPKIDSEKFSDTKNKFSQETEDDKLTREEKMLRNLDMLRKLGELKSYGVKLSNNYDINSDYKMMKYEYELHTNIKAKQNTVKWGSNMLVGLVKGIEMLNDNYNPFDIKLAGWSDKVNSDLSSYYDVLGEIYEKWNTPGKKMAPEIKLFLMLSGGAVGMQIHRGVAKLVPDTAKEIEDDNDFVEEMRSKAVQDTRKTGNQKANLYQKMEKEHDEANKKMADLEEIRMADLEHERIKRRLNEQKPRFDQLKRELLLSETIASEERNIMPTSEQIKLQKEIYEQNEEKIRELQRQSYELNKLMKNNEDGENLANKKIVNKQIVNKQFDDTKSNGTNSSRYSVNRRLAEKLQNEYDESNISSSSSTRSKKVSVMRTVDRDTISLSKSKSKTK